MSKGDSSRARFWTNGCPTEGKPPAHGLLHCALDGICDRSGAVWVWIIEDVLERIRGHDPTHGDLSVVPTDLDVGFGHTMQKGNASHTGPSGRPSLLELPKLSGESLRLEFGPSFLAFRRSQVPERLPEGPRVTASSGRNGDGAVRLGLLDLVEQSVLTGLMVNVR